MTQRRIQSADQTDLRCENPIYENRTNPESYPKNVPAEKQTSGGNEK
jgi:hypothetical protein